MRKQWKTVVTIYAILQVFKTIWEFFSKDPIIKAILKMFDITTTPTFLGFVSKYGLLIFSIIILLVIYIPILKFRIFGLKQIVSQTFKNKTISLDGRNYIDCVFENCTLRWNGRDYKLSNVKFIGSRRIESQNPTICNTIDLLKFNNFLEKQFSESWKHVPKEYFN